MWVVNERLGNYSQESHIDIFKVVRDFLAFFLFYTCFQSCIYKKCVHILNREAAHPTNAFSLSFAQSNNISNNMIYFQEALLKHGNNSKHLAGMVH